MGNYIRETIIFRNEWRRKDCLLGLEFLLTPFPFGWHLGEITTKQGNEAGNKAWHLRKGVPFLGFFSKNSKIIIFFSPRKEGSCVP